MFEQATPCRERGAAFARPLPKAASLGNYKAPDIPLGAYAIISLFAFNNLYGQRLGKISVR